MWRLLGRAGTRKPLANAAMTFVVFAVAMTILKVSTIDSRCSHNHWQNIVKLLRFNAGIVKLRRSGRPGKRNFLIKD